MAPTADNSLLNFLKHPFRWGHPRNFHSSTFRQKLAAPEDKGSEKIRAACSLFKTKRHLFIPRKHNHISLSAEDAVKLLFRNKMKCSGRIRWRWVLRRSPHLQFSPGIESVTEQFLELFRFKWDDAGSKEPVDVSSWMFYMDTSIMRANEAMG